MVQQANIELNILPPVRRVWFYNPGQTRLIQLQEDRFIFNWKKAPLDQAYPSYDVVIKEFETEYKCFRDFLFEEKLGAPEPRQYELVYTNFIGPENGLAESGASGILVDHQRAMTENRFLPEPEVFNWASSYAMEGGIGRLHVHAQSAFRMPKMVPLVRLDLTARGIPPNPTGTTMRDWFDAAHVYITQGFADITSPILQTKYWKKLHE